MSFSAGATKQQLWQPAPLLPGIRPQQRTLQEALNFDFVFHQQQPHDLMFMHSCRVSVLNRRWWLFGFGGSPPHSGEVAFRLVTVAVVIDVTRRLCLRLRT
jgi:hypothetical protein